MAEKATAPTPQAPSAMTKTYRLKGNADGVAPASIMHPTLNIQLDNELLKSKVTIIALQKEDKFQNTNWFTTLVEEVNG